jgi:hypothetical protein
VLALIAEGRSDAEIAASLCFGVSTVESHINALFAKLGVRDPAQVIAPAWGRELRWPAHAISRETAVERSLSQEKPRLNARYLAAFIESPPNGS